MLNKHHEELKKELLRCKTLEDKFKRKQLEDYCIFYKNKLNQLIDYKGDDHQIFFSMVSIIAKRQQAIFKLKDEHV